MGRRASQITSLTIVYSIVYSGVDQRKYQSSASLAFVRGIHRRPVNSPHKWPVTRKKFPFDDVIMPSLDFDEIICGCHYRHLSSPSNLSIVRSFDLIWTHRRRMSVVASQITTHSTVSKLTSKEHLKSASPSYCEWNPTVIGGFPSQRQAMPVICKAFPCHDVIVFMLL